MAVDYEKVRSELHSMIVCTFGYYEVEREIFKRCMEAIRKKNMSYLKKDLVVYCTGEAKIFSMRASRVCLMLYKYGIWQYVKGKVNE